MSDSENEKPLFEVIEGQPKICNYVFDTDQSVAEGIENQSHHIPPLRNLRAEIESKTGQSTPE